MADRSDRHRDTLNTPGADQAENVMRTRCANSPFGPGRNAHEQAGYMCVRSILSDIDGILQTRGRSYMVYLDSSSGAPAVLEIILRIFYSIFELHIGDDFRQIVEPADSAPTLLGALSQLEHQGEQGLPAAATPNTGDRPRIIWHQL